MCYVYTIDNIKVYNHMVRIMLELSILFFFKYMCEGRTCVFYLGNTENAHVGDCQNITSTKYLDFAFFYHSCVSCGNDVICLVNHLRGIFDRFLRRCCEISPITYFFFWNTRFWCIFDCQKCWKAGGVREITKIEKNASTLNM